MKNAPARGEQTMTNNRPKKSARHDRLVFDAARELFANVWSDSDEEHAKITRDLSRTRPQYEPTGNALREVAAEMVGEEAPRTDDATDANASELEAARREHQRLEDESNEAHAQLMAAQQRVEELETTDYQERWDEAGEDAAELPAEDAYMHFTEQADPDASTHRVAASGDPQRDSWMRGQGFAVEGGDES